ncbi:MAG: helix-turn-helix transcriptional regulator [Bacillota bacterium]
MSKIGRQIKFWREQKGISARSLAAKVNLTQSAISKIETGASVPSLATLKRICDVLDISLSDFFATTTGFMAFPEHLFPLLQEAKHLTPFQAEQLAKFIAAMREAQTT